MRREKTASSIFLVFIIILAGPAIYVNVHFEDHTEVNLSPHLEKENSEEAINTYEPDAVTKSPKILYPTPASMAHPNATPYVKPLFGEHRPHKDAVFAFAEQYPVETYVQFLSFLRDTGYQGDVVLSVASVEKMKPNVEKYLRQQASASLVEETGIAVIVYTVDWTCFKKDGKPIDHVSSGFTNCKAKLYGLEDENGSLKELDDPREPRPVATARYEIYWIWSINYKRESRILLVDVRDTYFQLDPFHTIPKLSEKSKGGGILHLFGENHNATSISRSNYNRRWINQAYGSQKMQAIKDEQVICSGSTIGDAVAIESYLRVMVKQFDDTKCKATGCDQGFHNYVYYYHLLENAMGISKVTVYPQGRGAINNLAAMRIKPLREWGVLDKDNLVLNWDGSISPVVHQFDRDDELKKMMKVKVSKLMRDIRFS